MFQLFLNNIQISIYETLAKLQTIENYKKNSYFLYNL